MGVQVSPSPPIKLKERPLYIAVFLFDKESVYGIIINRRDLRQKIH